MIVIFDLDGTLLDTYDLIEKTYCYVLDNYISEYKYDKSIIKTFFGPPLIDTFMWITNNDEKRSQYLVERFHEYNLSHHKDYLKIYPNVYDTLKKLKENGHSINVFSNKAKEAIILGLKIMGLDQFVSEIVGLEDVINPKPNKEGIEKILNKINKKEEVIMVGDTYFDILAGKNAKVFTCGVTYAKTSKEDFISYGADYIIDDMSELIEIVNNIVRG